MCNYKGKIGRVLVALFFIFSFTSLPLVAYAEGEETPTEIPETPSDSGEEWGGDIVDPTPAPHPTPTPTPTPTPGPQPTPVPTSETTYSTPATARNTTKTTTTEVTTDDTPENIPEETLSEEITTNTEPEIPVEPQIEYFIDLSDILASYGENTSKITIPETKEAKTQNLSKTSIIALVSANILFFATLSIWAGLKAHKITKFEKIYKEALTKSHQVKKAKITRAAS